jgi:hypothetical protein
VVFPLSVAGNTSIPTDRCRFREIEDNIARIEDLLIIAGVKTLARDGESIVFKSGVGRMLSFNSNVLLPFDSGRIDVEGDGDRLLIKYQASTSQLLIIVTLTIVGFAIFFAYHRENFTNGTLPPFWFFGLGWLWLFGMNYIIGAIRFRRWLRRGLERPEMQTC